MGKYFGTDGIRGEANVTLHPMTAFKIGQFLGWYYGSEKECKIVIGKDTRRSSYMFEQALAAGLVSSGADAYFLHVTTTPSVSYAVRTEDFDCGIMISASHNPFYDNGIKLMNGYGEKLEESVIEKIEQYIDGEFEIPPMTREQIGKVVDFSAGRNRYIGHLITIPTKSFKGMRVGLDCSNGSAFSIAKSVFDALGAKTYVINDEPDGLNINDKCGSTHMEALCDLVREEKLDIGFAYDGDADRCLCVDSNGEIVTGDGILYAYGKYMKENGKLQDNTVVTTVMSNYGLYKAFDEAGINYATTAVGDKYVYECIQKNNYSIGGEQSGHIIFSRFANTGDGILTSLLVMDMVVQKKQPLHKLVEGFTVFPQVLKNVRVADKDAALNDPDVVEIINKTEELLGDSGRVLVRASGTEPLIRVMVEASTEELCENSVDEIIFVLRKKGHILIG